MTGKLLFSTFLMSILLVTACTKETEPKAPPAPTYPIEGLWIGTYSVDAMPAQGQLFYSFAIYPDGTLLTKSKGGDGKFYYSSGTWTLSSGNVFNGTITTFDTYNSASRITQTVTANYSNTGKLTDGTWKDTFNPHGAGLTGKFSTFQRIN